jgi:beta-lactamase superfamily II metal-dependent hydrolase
MDKIRVRAYNVLFGDAFLITFPEKNPNGTAETRNILIDVGNFGSDKVFKPVIEDVLRELNGRSLDLYVMTHEHLDHVQGLLYAKEKLFPGADDELAKKLKTRYTWLTASSEEGYYEKHPQAKKKLDEFDAAYREIDKFMRALDAEVSSTARALWLNNSAKTKNCVKYLKTLSEDTFYVSRARARNKQGVFDPNDCHPFAEARLEVWAPEEDTSTYYSKTRMMPMSLGVTNPSNGSRERASLTDVYPPPGVDAGAFYNLVKMRRNGHFDNLLAIDKAANNTSVVFSLDWRGVRLLFPGDAEQESWKIMNKLYPPVLKPVHFLKMSHHGSQTGTPEQTILNKILPLAKADNKPRKAVLSSKEGVYENVPDPKTVDLIKQRCDDFYEVDDLEGGKYVDIEFEEE